MAIHEVGVAVAKQGGAGRIPDVGAAVAAIIEGEGGGGTLRAGESDGGTRGSGSPGEFVVLPARGLPVSEAGRISWGESHERLPNRPVDAACTGSPEVDADNFDSGQESRGGEGDPGKKEGV